MHLCSDCGRHPCFRDMVRLQDISGPDRGSVRYSDLRTVVFRSLVAFARPADQRKFRLDCGGAPTDFSPCCLVS